MLSMCLSICILPINIWIPGPVFMKLGVYEVISESSRTVIIVSASVKEDEKGGQGYTSASLLHESATWHCSMNTHYFYKSAFWLHISSSAMDDKSSNVSASTFACSSVNLVLKSLKCFVRFWRTFFKPDNGSWLAFTFQGWSSVSWRWRTFRVTKQQQNDRKCWKNWELINEDRRRPIHKLADTLGDLNRKSDYAPHCSFIMTMHAHTSRKTTEFVTNNNMVIFPHPPYSPDLAPCDFALLPKLKMKLKVRCFETVSWHPKGIASCTWQC
jgi:hypothetical protein